jgi:hypothetical protein
MYRLTTDTPRHRELTVRHAGTGDEHALALLSALDSGPRIHGPALVAEADARIVAALPVGSGRPLADPFEPTADAVALLELRLAQLRAAEESPRPSLRSRLRSLRPRLAWARAR